MKRKNKAANLSFYDCMGCGVISAAAGGNWEAFSAACFVLAVLGEVQNQ